MSAGYYTPRVVQTGKVPSTQTNFPGLFLLNATRYKTEANGGHVKSALGYDIRPNTSTALSYDITFELVPGVYNATAGTGEMWGLITSIADATPVYVSYGDASLTTDGSSTSTWPSAFQVTAHQANGTVLSLLDSTSNVRNGANASATAAAAQIDGGTAYSGSSQSWSIPDFDLGNARTYSFWVNMTSLPAGANIVNIIGKRPTSNEMAVYVTSAGKIRFLLFTTGGLTVDLTSTNAMSTGTWYKWDCLWDGTDGFIRFNGAADISGHSGTGTAVHGTDNYFIGTEGDGSRFMTGKTDELRMLNIANSLNTSATEYNNQSNEPAFWSDGTEVAVGGSSPLGSYYYDFVSGMAA